MCDTFERNFGRLNHHSLFVNAALRKHHLYIFQQVCTSPTVVIFLRFLYYASLISRINFKVVNISIALIRKASCMHVSDLRTTFLKNKFDAQ